MTSHAAGSSSESMHILHVISQIDPRTGGPATALRGLTLAQRQAGLAVRILATYRADGDLSLAQSLRDDGVEVELVGPCVSPLMLHRHLAPSTAANVAWAQVVHIHACWEQVQHLAARQAHRQGKPYIIRPCGMLDPWSLRQSRWRKRLYMAWRLRRNLRHASLLHFTTSTERDLTASLRLTAPAVVEPNGLDLSEFERLPPAGTFRQAFPQLGQRPYVLFLSRIHPKKGLDLLIPAFAQAAPPDHALVIAGPAEEAYLEQVQQMVRDHGLSDRVLFTGMVRGQVKVAALAEAELFALSSYQENFGIAVIEALAAGTPVLISDQVNIHAQIAAAGVGGVVPAQVEPLAQALRQWLTQPHQRAQAAAKARPFVWEHYDWNRIAQRWVSHYQRLLDEHAQARPAR